MLSSSTSCSIHSLVALPDLHSFPTRRSSDLGRFNRPGEGRGGRSTGWMETGQLAGGRSGEGLSAALLCRTREREVSGPSGENRSEEHTSELQSRGHLVCRLLLEKKKITCQFNVS